MATVIIEEITKTEKAGLFTICFEGDAATEFEKFMNKFKEDAERKDDLSIILTAINKMLTASGFLERYFRYEGKMSDRVVALPIEQWRDVLVNDFERSMFALHPEIESIKEQLYADGAIYASMTGSGSAFFGIFDSEEKAAKACDNSQCTFRCVVRG